MKKTNNVCVVDSVYTLFIYLILMPNEIKSTLFILSDGIPESVKNKLPCKINFPAFKDRKFERIYRLVYCFYFSLFHKKVLKSIQGKNVYGQDHLFYSHLFVTDGFVLLEDGLGNYQSNKKSSLSAKVRKFLAGNEEWGYSDKVKKIYLTGLSNVPMELQKKVEFVDLRNLWLACAEDKKSYIKNIYSFGDYSSNEECDVLLLTQPFSEDTVISENEKINLYKKILGNYSGKVAIKPHPREKTDYSKHFDCYVFEKTFPVQLLLYVLSPKKIATCFSSISSEHFKIPVETYGTSINEKLKKRYGDIEGNAHVS